MMYSNKGEMDEKHENSNKDTFCNKMVMIVYLSRKKYRICDSSSGPHVRIVLISPII